MNYIFSDKTGTLTRNVMEFRYMLVGSTFYGDGPMFKDQQEESRNEMSAY